MVSPPNFSVRSGDVQLHPILPETDPAIAVPGQGMGRIARSSGLLLGSLFTGTARTRMLQLPNRHRRHEQGRRERKCPDQPEHQTVELKVDETADQALNDDGADGAGASRHAEQGAHRIGLASRP